MLLAFQSLTKRFGGLTALNGVTCQVDGRAVGLLGPNGAGKTTLMRICLGLLEADSGEVRVLDLDARRSPLLVRSKLGFAAEGPGRIPGLSGLECVSYVAELCGLRRRKALLRAHDILDLVGLDESRFRPVETYSTGMHQRVKVAMALAHDPALVLLDEPTSGLDPESRDDLLDLVIQLRDGGGPAVLLSTHLLKDVERTCDACIIMQAGRVRFAGPLSDLKLRIPAEYELRTAYPNAALKTALLAKGVTLSEGHRPEVFFAHLPEGADTRLLWAVAQEVDARLIHVEPRAATLEDAFLERIA